MRPLQLSLFETSPKPKAPEPREGRAVSLLPPLPPQRPASAVLAERLAAVLREPVDVELTDNAWTMVSYRRRAGRLLFRLHHMFGAAEEVVLRAIAGFTGRARKAAGHVIDEHIRKHRHLIRQREQQGEPALTTRGRYYDLDEIYARLNREHFNGQVAARIGWGRNAPGRRRRSIKMGVYFHERKLIKIHPALDDARVPAHFVEMVVFHEMLHQILPPSLDQTGRRSVHGRAFRAAERKFPDYARARAWEKANLDLLLSKRT